MDSTVCLVLWFLPRLVGRGLVGNTAELCCGLYELLLCVDAAGHLHMGGATCQPETLPALVLTLGRVGTLKLCSWNWLDLCVCVFVCVFLVRVLDWERRDNFESSIGRQRSGPFLISSGRDESSEGGNPQVRIGGKSLTEEIDIQ